MQNKLKTGPNGLALITESEGVRLVPYNDARGFATVGYGHLIRRGPVTPADLPITKEQAIEFLKTDLAEFESIINEKVSVQLNQNQFDALVDFVYNLGIGTFFRSALLSLVNRSNFEKAATVFRVYVYAGEKVLPGLVARRNKEATLFNTPVGQ